MRRRSRSGRGAVLTTVAIGLIGGLALAGCARGGSGGSPDQRGPITIWYSNNEQEVAWGEAMVEAWNADHPDEQIRAQEIPAGASSEEVIGASIAAGNAPCLIFNTAPVAVAQFEKQGGLVNLSQAFPDGKDYIESRSGDLAQLYANADGDYLQMPWKSNPVVIFYNKDLFEKAGLDPENPELATYDEFLDTAETLVDSGVAPYAINPAPTNEFFQTNFDFYPLYAAETGGANLLEDGTATFDDADGVAVAEFWRTVYADKLASQEQYQGDAFADGIAAMAIVGPWAVSVYGDSVNWGSVPVPTSQGTPADETYTFSDAKNVGLFSACVNQGTAWDVLKFATGPDQDLALLDTTGQMPIRADLADTYADYFAEHPDYAAFGDQASRIVEVPYESNAVAIMQKIRDAYSRAVIFGEGDIPQALKDAAAQADDLAAQP
jgi:multiple sugar transport system substrate-binding protein